MTNPMDAAARPRVLVVDDDPIGLRILQDVLADLDCRMLVATSGERALELCSKNLPALILLDVKMKGMNGFETCKAIKANPATRDAVVLFLSAKTELASRLEGLACGGIDYITKPYSAEEVRAKVATHLENLRLREELSARNRELDLAIQKQDQLLGMAAHDLRTPLTAILVASKTLKRRRLGTEQQAELLEIIESSSNHMQGLIEELLDMAALRSSQVRVRPTVGCLNNLVTERLRLHTYAAQTKKITLKTELAAMPSLRLDHQKIGQVIDNLVTNAIKYSWPESEVRIATGIKDGNIELAVEDHGVGISPKDLGQLFEPFAKLGSRPTQGESSHGLGLAIARNIVHTHGGKILVESTPDKGSTFTVRIPLAS